MRTTRILAGLATAALAAGAVTAAPSVAAPAAKPAVLAKGLLSPLSLAVDGPDVYVAQTFGGSLELLSPGKKPQTIYRAKGGAEVGAVSARRGTVTFGVSASDKDGNYVSTKLFRIAGSGKAVPFADLLGYEKAHNPDGDVVYGARGITPECAAQWPTEDAPPATYPGVVDSHPYATTSTRRTTYVADAAMNAVLAVTPTGKVSTVAVLPAIPTEITADVAQALKLPQCAVGLDYYFEAVPTDVELGPDGNLYVSSLPGGPEDPSMGARGSVFKVTPRGAVTKVAGGLVSPTGVAVADNGDVYVSQLFSGAVARIKHGSHHATTVRQLTMTGDVEVAGRDLLVTTDVLPPEGKAPNGKVVRFRR
jgi:hypothetical protein